MAGVSGGTVARLFRAETGLGVRERVLAGSVVVVMLAAVAVPSDRARRGPASALTSSPRAASGAAPGCVSCSSEARAAAPAACATFSFCSSLSCTSLGNSTVTLRWAKGMPFS